MSSAARLHSGKRLPPYGAAIRSMVYAGRRPVIFGGAIVVSLDWKIGSCWPRIVLPPEESPQAFDLSFLAGLDVMIFWRPGHPPDHLQAAIDAVNAARPAVCTALELPRLVEA